MRVLLMSFALIGAPAAAQLPSSGAVSSTVNGALDVRVDRPELNAPSAASITRRGADPVIVEADASVRVRKGERCAWGGQEHRPVERAGRWYCERPPVVQTGAAVKR